MFCFACLSTIAAALFGITSLSVALLAGILMRRKKLVLALFLFIVSLALIYASNMATDQADSCKSAICSKVK